jgi:hypothetical protein
MAWREHLWGSPRSHVARFMRRSALHARSARQSAVVSNLKVVAEATCRQVHSQSEGFLACAIAVSKKKDEVASFVRRKFC